MCIIVDFLIDEGVNLSAVATQLHLRGATRIKAIGTHSTFSGDAATRIAASPIEEVIVSDSVNQAPLLKVPELARKLRIIPIAPLLSEAIERVHTENTLSTLFEK